MRNDIASQLVAYFDKENILVYGINLAEAMNDAPNGFRPQDYLPGSKSIICFAIPVPESIYSLHSYRKEFIWRTQNLFYRKLDTHSLMIVNILENNGAKALPAFGCLPQRYNSKKEIAGHLNLIRMGSITGIGFIGKNGLLINSLYGSRMMFGGVITDAELPSMSRPQEQGKGCPDDCDICITICPVNAIIPKENRVNVMKCLYHTATAPVLPKFRFFLLRLFKPESSLRLMNITAFDEHTFHACSLCVSECPYGSGN